MTMSDRLPFLGFPRPKLIDLLFLFRYLLHEEFARSCVVFSVYVRDGPSVCTYDSVDCSIKLDNGV